MFKKLFLLSLGLSILAFSGCDNTASDPDDDPEKSANANLATLTVSAGSLAPAFSADTLSYSVFVDNSVDGVTVSGTAADSKATVSSDVTLTGLVAGTAQTATITVTAESAATKSYQVSVTRSLAAPVGAWTQGVFSLILLDDGTYVFQASSQVVAVGIYTIAGTSIRLLDDGETADKTGEYAFSVAEAGITFSLVADVDAKRAEILKGLWAKGSIGPLGSQSGKGSTTITGTVSLPAGVTVKNAKWYVGIDTDTDGSNGNTANMYGIMTGNGFTYTLEKVPAGTYYLYTVIDADHSWTRTTFAGPVAAGDYWAYYGGAPTPAPNFTVPASGSLTENMTTQLFTK